MIPLGKVLYAVSIAVLGLLLSRWIPYFLFKSFKEKLGVHLATIMKKLLAYGILLIALIWVLGIFGVKIGAILTAIGLFSVAIGFAARTSVSNLISGIFILFDRPFVIGDAITVAGTEGIVISIDILSTKVRTSDNTYVRIPNETVLRSVVTNLSKLGKRRTDIEIKFKDVESLEEAKEVLKDSIENLQDILKKPKPHLFVKEDGTPSLKVIVWMEEVATDRGRRVLMEKIEETLKNKGIDFEISLLK